VQYLDVKGREFEESLIGAYRGKKPVIDNGKKRGKVGRQETLKVIL